MIQRQIWKDEIRILITDEQNHGSVQISIPRYECNISGKADALIYALYVDTAEQQAKLNKIGIIGLEFDKEESESFVLAWYLKIGYKPFSKKSKLLIKEL